jgi:hypothetical protein
MDEKVAQEVFDELLPALEALDTKCSAILQFLKDKGIASDDELVPYLEQAGNGSSVRWRVARVRINHLLSAAKTEESVGGTPSTKAPEEIPEAAANTSPEAVHEQAEKDVQGAEKPADNPKAGEDVAAHTEK